MKIKRSWREQKVMLKQRFSFLTDSDFEFKDGQKESMLDTLSIKLQKTRKELQMLFAELQTYWSESRLYEPSAYLRKTAYRIACFDGLILLTSGHSNAIRKQIFPDLRAATQWVSRIHLSIAVIPPMPSICENSTRATRRNKMAPQRTHRYKSCIL